MVRWRVDDAFRVARGPRGEADDRRRSGSTDIGPVEWIGPSSESNGTAPGGRSPAGDSPTTSQRTPGAAGQERPVVGQIVVVTEAVGGDHDRRRGRRQDVVDLLRPVEVHDGDDHRPQVGGRPEREPASTQFGSWNTTTSPGPTPSAASAPASARADRSTSAKVPRHGRTAERTRKGTSPIRPRPASTISPRV